MRTKVGFSCSVQVINNGEAHADEVNTSFIQPWVQDALDSVEFIMGAPDTKWGSLRSSMGHPPPWNLTYFAIGNEVGECTKISLMFHSEQSCS